MDKKLASLLVDLSSLSLSEAEQLVFEEYVQLYLDKGVGSKRIGVRKAHDGRDVKFGETRFQHAFYVSSDKTTRRYRRGQV